MKTFSLMSDFLTFLILFISIFSYICVYNSSDVDQSPFSRPGCVFTGEINPNI